MKKCRTRRYILILSAALPAALLIILGVIVCNNRPVRQLTDENEIIVQADMENKMKPSENAVLGYFGKNKSDLKNLADYLLKNNYYSPISMEERSFYIKLPESAVEMIERMFRLSAIKKVQLLEYSTLARSPEYSDRRVVVFQADSKHGSYEQGIIYDNESRKLTGSKKYNYIETYKDLGGGWTYYLYYYNRIKDEDTFRELAWNQLSNVDKETVKHDWREAAVSLAEWNSVGIKTDGLNRKLVVSVTFNTDRDGLLGPIVLYFDPYTKKAAGYAIRE